MGRKELEERQAWPLRQKIDHALFTIETFLSRVNNNAYVAFSGGKDSTVLLDLVRVINADIPAVFVNTGNEWPDIISFVRHLRDDLGYNILEIHPKMTPKATWEKYGFPLVSKAQAEYIHGWRINPERAQRRVEAAGRKWSFGYVSDRWKFLIDEKFDTNNECCRVLKKDPSHAYEKESGRFPILGTMASESDQRAMEYISRGGCNTFSEKQHHGTRSTPLAIWTDADIWAYIEERHLGIADIYRKGAKRTGCVGCGFGCYVKGDARFDLLYNLYPRYYEKVLEYTNGGVSYREALRKVLAVTDKTLPDEHSSDELFPLL